MKQDSCENKNMAEWMEIEVIDDDDEYGVRDMVVCSNCYWSNLKKGKMYEEAPENYKELKYCPNCGALMKSYIKN